MSRRCGSSKPTPTPLNGEATKSTRDAKKKGKNGGLSVRGRKTVNDNRCHITCKGDRGENVLKETRKTGVVKTFERGARRNYTTEKVKTRSHTVLCHIWSRQNIHNAPGSVLVGTGRTKMKRTRKSGSPIPQLSGPITQTTARH